jgi:hypothetical protein
LAALIKLRIGATSQLAKFKPISTDAVSSRYANSSSETRPTTFSSGALRIDAVGGMPGLWRAVRQEGFTRLAARLEVVPMSADPVRDLAALGAAYVSNALANPDLYRVMLDAGFELEDPAASDETLQCLVRTIDRAKYEGRFRGDVDALTLATQSWAIGHGLVSLVATGPLSLHTLDHGAAMLAALFVSCGDDPRACRRSVELGWRSIRDSEPHAASQNRTAEA